MHFFLVSLSIFCVLLTWDHLLRLVFCSFSLFSIDLHPVTLRLCYVNQVFPAWWLFCISSAPALFNCPQFLIKLNPSFLHLPFSILQGDSDSLAGPESIHRSYCNQIDSESQCAFQHTGPSSSWKREGMKAMCACTLALALGGCQESFPPPCHQEVGTSGPLGLSTKRWRHHTMDLCHALDTAAPSTLCEVHRLQLWWPGESSQLYFEMGAQSNSWAACPSCQGALSPCGRPLLWPWESCVLAISLPTACNSGDISSQSYL